MSLSIDLKIRGQYGSTPLVVSGAPSAPSGGASFSEVFSAAYQSVGATDYESCFQAASEAYQVPVNLLKAVAKVESDFTPTAVSHCGAQGVMQLMPATARYLGVNDAFDPAQNIMGGAKYIRMMLDRFNGDVSKALAAYNAGPGSVEKCGGVPSYAQAYVNKVLGYAGSGVSVPAQTFATGAAASPSSSAAGYGAVSGSGGLTAGELYEQVEEAYHSSGLNNQDAARLFVQRFLTSDDEEEEGRYQTEDADEYRNLREAAMQVDL